ncbi:penicillin-binding protein activator LpoB [Jeongeupia sp. USM3]|uniref:penicillin-binding protein activator LpoB n=1 Tax=Jeongeupia sp. USM3 TaxID=1906741 RepID=UPI00089DD83E|nr:penicillin-binding protein activator LpoB [Jeongeupia sp. USM3]AOY00819.1 penicillin-binding protein activator LpoB [Jeongeupia sp. USM3]
MHRPLTSLIGRLAALCLVLGLTACAVVDVSKSAPLPAKAQWAMLPIVNHTETPLAGLRAEAILQPLLHQRGIADLRVYPAGLSKETLLAPDERAALEAARDWARKEQLRYAIGGSVDEWRYKVGVDGEPAVGLSLTVWDLQTGQVVWSGVGGKSGFSRESLAAVAQKLMRDIVNGLPLSENSGAENR